MMMCLVGNAELLAETTLVQNYEFVKVYNCCFLTKHQYNELSYFHKLGMIIASISVASYFNNFKHHIL